MADKTDIVKVDIVVTEKVTYRKTVEIPREEFERLDKELNWNHPNCQQALKKVEAWIDREDDWSDSDDLEVEDFYLAVDSPKEDARHA
jgi:hypothetical protein